MEGCTVISKEAKDLMEQLRKTYVPVVDWEQTDWEQFRADVLAMVPDGPYPQGVTFRSDTIGGVDTEWTVVEDASEKIIVHFHGGGMCMGTASIDRFMLSHIAVLTKRNAVSVEYRLSPEYAHPAAVEDCVAVYTGLLEQGYQAKDIVLLGESAGGMLVMSVCAWLKQNHVEMPGAICAISPSVDSRYQSQSMLTNRETELAVNLNLVEMMEAIYYCGVDPLDPIASPIHSDLHGWPPTYLMACRKEILRDEAVRMCVRLQESGVPCELTIEEELFHTYMLHDIPESYEAFQKIAEFFSRY